MRSNSSQVGDREQGTQPNGHSLGGAVPATRDYAAANAELERSLAEVWKRLLQLDHVGPDEDFFELGGHSLLGVELVYEIEEQLERVCTLTMLFRNPTIRSLAAELHVGGVEATEPVVLELAGGSGPTVFCICGVHVYQELAEELAPAASLSGVFLPVEQELYAGGRGGLSVEAIARRYVASIRVQQPHGPYRLLGFCFGGILAYEAAQQLTQAGEEVSLLVMVDSTLGSGMPSFRRRLSERVRRVSSRQGDRLPVSWQRRLLGEKWVSQASRLDRARMRIYTRAMQRYRIEAFPGPTVLVKPEGGGQYPEAAWAWERYVSELEVCELPGSHQTHLERGHAHLVARALRPHVERAARVA